MPPSQIKTAPKNIAPKIASNIVTIVLAGGQGRRMGYVDKPLIPLAGKALLDHVLERVKPQSMAVALNANGAASRFQRFNLPIIADSVEDQPGPLAGILAGLDWAASDHPRATHVLSVPGDAPFIPCDLAMRLAASLTQALDGSLEAETTLARACSFGRPHPVIGLWPIAIRADLRDQLVNLNIRKIDRFTANYPLKDVAFDGLPDPFFNVNTPEDRNEAERILKQK